MNTGFYILKIGSHHLDYLLFLIPLIVLLIIWGSSHLIRMIKKSIQEFKEMKALFNDDFLNNFIAFVQPA